MLHEVSFASYNGRDQVQGWIYVPACKPKGIVQVIHGFGEHSRRYLHMISAFMDAGYIVAADDHVGHGKTAMVNNVWGDWGDKGPHTMMEDEHTLKGIVCEKYPDLPYFLFGHSMGSFIARNYLCRYGSGIGGAVIVGTGMQPAGLIFASKAMAGIQKLFCGSKHVSHFMDKAAFGGYNKRIDSPRTSSDWLSRNTENVDRYIEDELCGFTFTVNGFQTLFELIRRLQKQENLEKVPQNLPILMVSGAEDPVGDYGKGVHKACDSLKRAGVKNITVKLYENDRHELLNEDDAEVAMEDIWQWICKEIPGIA